MLHTRRHPKTGEELAWLAFLRKNGSVRYIAPVLGAAPDDPDDDPASGEGDSDNTSDSGGDAGDDTDSDASGDEDKKAKDDKDAALEAQKEKTRLADKRASAAEAELKRMKLKDASELEQAKARVAELEEENKSLQEQGRTLTLKQALLAHPTYGASAWNDPEDVLAALDKAVSAEDVTVEDGEVKGLDTWLKGLAKSKSYWLKRDQEDGDEGDSAPTGSPVGSGRKKATGKLSEEDLRRRFPALR